MKKLDRITSGIAGGFRNLAGREVSRALSGATANQLNMAGSVPMYKKGGRVKKTGLAVVHKNELILTAKQANDLKKMLKK